MKNIPVVISDSMIVRQILDELEDIWEEYEVAETHKFLIGQYLGQLPSEKCEEIAKAEASMTEKGRNYAQLVERAYRWRCTCIMKILDLEDNFKDEFPENTEISRIDMTELQMQFSQEVDSFDVGRKAPQGSPKTYDRTGRGCYRVEYVCELRSQTNRKTIQLLSVLQRQ